MSEDFEKWFDNYYDDYGFYPADIADARIVWDAATKVMQAKLDAQAEELAALRDFAQWLTGCGYDFTQHQYFLDNRHLLRGKLQVKE